MCKWFICEEFNQIPIHFAFLEDVVEKNNSGDISNKDSRVLIEIIEKKVVKKLSKKTKEQYIAILNYMDDKEWHKTSEIAKILCLKETRTKELLKELVTLEILEDNGKTKGKKRRKNK